MWGCVLALLLLSALVYGCGAGMPYLWWGRGYSGAQKAERDRQSARAASTLYVYDAVIVVERDRVIFRRSLWEPVRTGLITALGAAVAIFAMRGRKKARWWMLIGGTAAGLIAAFFAVRRHPVVTVPRGAPGRVVVHVDGELMGSLTEEETHYDIVLVDGERRTRLVRLPWNAGHVAETWRGIVEEKLRP
ncbi:MAG TPA: hypothetical protein VNI54_07750 [Thermoanaerobaculia bacterium]|nr:hypothetical protein [Thermoanaerobaculia bacterium]